MLFKLYEAFYYSTILVCREIVFCKQIIIYANYYPRDPSRYDAINYKRHYRIWAIDARIRFYFLHKLKRHGVLE